MMNEGIFCRKPEGQKGWRLPPGMADMTEVPLYLAVAVWGLRLEQVITTDDVSRNFCITQRQASDILHYITHEGTKWVKYERRVIIRDVRGRRTGLRIRAVIMPEPDEIRPRRKKNVVTARRLAQDSGKILSGDSRLARIKALRIWMVQRRPGDTVPDALVQSLSGEMQV
ncbi:CaiF/GrlA family transcriptional regulator [Salmonella enterica]|nr:CaiF/GrlA family transcriptional regulator [Salmonella enterica]